MLLALLLVFLSLLQGCIAPAVSDDIANPAPPFLEATRFLTSSGSTSDVCDNLSNCRSLAHIIGSCLATIFSCILVAVHPNIPGPTERVLGTRNILGVELWKAFEAYKVLATSLLVPEWPLALATQQFLRARYCAAILEQARVEAAVEAADKAITQNNRNWTQEGHTTRSSSSDQGRDQAPGIGLEDRATAHANSNRNSVGSVRQVGIGKPYNRNGQASIVRHQSRDMSTTVAPEPAHQLDYLRQLEFELRRTERSWTIAHAFFINMGGFYSYHGGKPVCQLEYEDVLALVKSGSLVPPTSDELGDKSKGDSLSKAIATHQTIWFIVQCIARRIENRVITNLEIMTLAYTVITVAMYAAWWYKPLNVRCPIRVQGENALDKDTQPFEWSDLIGYFRRKQDRLVISLSGEERDPTFWAGIIALTIAMAFGAVHCAAWYYAFPSLAEQWVWRVCAIAIIAIPLALTMALVAFMVFNPDPSILAKQSGRSAYTYHIPLMCMPLCALLYIPARIFLLYLSFSTLRTLPLSAYQTVEWTAFIPHV